MRKLLLLIIILSVVSGVSGCSATGPIFKPIDAISSNVATVYIYRPWQFFNGGGWPELFIDGKKEFALKNGGYGVVYLEPGSHEVKAEGSMLFTNWYPRPISFTYDYQANQEYYIRVTPKLGNMMAVGNSVVVSGSAQVSIVEKKDALTEITTTKKVN